MRHHHRHTVSSYPSLLAIGGLCLRIIYLITSGPTPPSVSSTQILTTTGSQTADTPDSDPLPTPQRSVYQQTEQQILREFSSTGAYSGTINTINTTINNNVRNTVSGLTGVRYTPIIRPTASVQQADIARLQYIYTQTKNLKVAELLIAKYLTDYRYNEAYQLLTPLTLQQQLDAIGAEKLLFIAANGSLLDSTTIGGKATFTGLLNTLHGRGLITNDTLYRYQGLLYLLQGDTSNYLSSLKKITSPVYMSQITTSLQRVSWFQQQKDMPEYYLQALLALDLMNNGYLKIAQQISARILVSKDSYILPHQILAYSHFVLNNRPVATQYALSLLDLDTTNKQRYIFMLGVSAYRQNQYANAIMYLNQVRDSELVSDAVRYMLLSYQALGDNKMIASTMQTLLRQSMLEKSDFGTMFDILFFEPYSQRSGFTFYQQNKQLAILILEQCYIKLPQQDQTICTYGKAGIFIAQQQLDKAVKYLYFLAKEMPTSAVYEALGQYHSSQGNLEQARNFMIQASLLSSDPLIKQRIKTSLLTTSP